MPALTAKAKLQAALLTDAGIATAALRIALIELNHHLAAGPDLEAAARDAKSKHELHHADMLLAAVDAGRLDGKNAEQRDAQLLVYCSEFKGYTAIKADYDAAALALVRHKAAVEAAANAFTAARYAVRLQAAVTEMVAATSE